MIYEKGSFTTVPIKMVEGMDAQSQVVFMHICKYLNDEGSCWPSMNRLAKDCGMSRRTVQRRIDLLVEKNVLSTEKRHREDGSYTSSLYRVVLSSTPSVRESLGVVSESHMGGVRESQHELNLIELNLDRTKHTRELGKSGDDAKSSKATKVSSEQSSHVNSIMDVFYTINPSLNYANKASRNAVTWMVNKWGVDATLRAAEFACSIHGQPYSPTITTPYQLKDKISQLKAYRDKQESQDTAITVI